MTVRNGLILALLAGILLVRAGWLPDGAGGSQYTTLFAAGHREHLDVSYPPPLATYIATHAFAAAVCVYLLIALAAGVTSPSWRRRIASPLTGLVFAAAATLVVNSLVAACDRAAGPRYLPDADLQWVQNPTVPAVVGEPLNEFGLRTPDLPAWPAPGVTRLLVLGDSATWGAGRGDPIPYPRQVERLGRDQGLRVEVVNAAVVGYCSLQGSRMLGRLLARYHPQVVLFGYNNDSGDDGGLPDELRTGANSLARAVQRVLYRSDLYLLLRQQVLRMVSRRPDPGPAGPAGPRVPMPTHLAIYAGMIDAVEARGGRAVILILPSPHGDFDAADCQLASRRHVPVIDLNELYTLSKKTRTELLPDGVHPAQDAHVLLGQIVLQHLVASGYLK